MAYFPDLSVYTYLHGSSDPQVLNVGWLNRTHPFSCCDTTTTFNDGTHYDLSDTLARARFLEFLRTDYLGRRQAVKETCRWQPEDRKLTTPQFYKFLKAQVQGRREAANEASNTLRGPAT